MSGSASYLTKRKWGRVAEGMEAAGTEKTGQVMQRAHRRKVQHRIQQGGFSCGFGGLSGKGLLVVRWVKWYLATRG